MGSFRETYVDPKVTLRNQEVGEIKGEKCSISPRKGSDFLLELLALQF